jgi:dimeric dUTPase (all-alpha-NTP-PPase superfamily)
MKISGFEEVGKVNLTKLFEAQKELRDRISYNEPDRFNKLILALLVELGECANEWRGFKFWSVNQLPHTSAVRVPAMMEEDKVYYNPLLEEYVDGLHFVLEIGLELGLEESKHLIYEIDGEPEVVLILIQTSTFVNELFWENYHCDDSDQSYDYQFSLYRGVVSSFIKIGEMLGFTWEEVEQAYFNKHAINIQRQENGY